MEQLQFDDNFAGEGFAPVTQIDYTKSLDRRNARLNRADEEALAQVRRNSQVRIQNAQDSGKGLAALGQLSSKLSNLLGTVAKERQEEQDAEDVATGFELYLNKGLDMSGFNETMGQAKNQAHEKAEPVCRASKRAACGEGESEREGSKTETTPRQERIGKREKGKVNEKPREGERVERREGRRGEREGD